MEQIERISQMEQRMERAAAAVMSLSAVLDRYEEVQEDISTLKHITRARPGSRILLMMRQESFLLTSGVAYCLKMVSGIC